MDQDGYTSIIFDITERVGPKGGGPEIDGRALTTHLEDIVGDDIETVKVWNSSATQFSRLEYVPYHRPGPTPPSVRRGAVANTNTGAETSPPTR